tara:strand:- start:5381 stop:6637 length:1257 start_codon:yes stop_codon:yes gene_type:complete
MLVSPSVSAGMSCRQRFRALSQLLSQHEKLWRPLAFQNISLPWQHDHLQLSLALEQLSMSSAESLQASSVDLATWLKPYLPVATELLTLCHLPKPITSPGLQPYPHSFECGIPGRKWQQVQAFVGAIGQTDQLSLPLLEWCGGKGHLGRCASWQWTQGGDSIDINADLVNKARRLSERFSIPLQHRQADALAASGRQVVAADQHALALHACGGLHLQLIEQAINMGTQRLSIAPCCYHLFLGEHSWNKASECYQPQSNLAKYLDLKLQASDLRTCVQQTVTAPEHDRRLRKTLQAWRLGFDLLQRELSGQDQYLPVPALANRWAKTSFIEVCQHIAELKSIALPGSVDWALWEARGLERLQWVTAFDLVRMAFRRPLELWLVLDRALKLEEADYKVELSEFCPPSLTPRNILIAAQKL